MEQTLEDFIDETIQRSQANGYHPTVFIGMRERHGTVVAIKRLVQSGDIQSGFRRLSELGLVEWTIESAILKFPDEFSPVDIECARFRLEQVESDD